MSGTGILMAEQLRANGITVELSRTLT